MPSAISVPLMMRRGSKALTLAQMGDLVGKTDEINALYAAFDEKIDIARLAETSATEALSTLTDETSAANAAIAEREEALRVDVEKHIEELADAALKEATAAQELADLATSIAARAEAVIADETALQELKTEFETRAAEANNEFVARDVAQEDRARELEQTANQLALDEGLVRAAEARNIREAERLSSVGARVQEAFSATPPAETPIAEAAEPVADA